MRENVQKEKTSIGVRLLRLIFADIPVIVWLVVLAIGSYLTVELIESGYNVLKYDWSGVLLFYAMVALIWEFISDFKLNLISAVLIPLFARNLFGLYILIDYVGEYKFLPIFTAVILLFLVLLDGLTKFIKSKFKLEDFSLFDFDDVEDLFDDLFYDEKEEKTKAILKLLRDGDLMTHCYSRLACDILKEQSNENSLAMSKEEQEKLIEDVTAIHERFEYVVNNCHSKDYVYGYFFIAYYCKNMYKDIFTKEKAREYLKKYISYGDFDVEDFVKMFEEGTKDFDANSKRTLFLEMFEDVEPMLNVVEIRKIQIERDKSIKRELGIEDKED